MTPPREFSALPPCGLREASPKAVSGRTSYLRVRLEFLPYPPLIPTLFNGCGFGPPAPFTASSAWRWIGHPVSGLRAPTERPVQTRLPCGSGHPMPLTLPARAARRTVLQKVRGHASRAPTVYRRRVSGSLSLPSRGPFHLSLTVLFSIGHWVVFSLAGWSPPLPPGFLVSRRTLDPASPSVLFAYGAFTLFGRLSQNRSAKDLWLSAVLTP